MLESRRLPVANSAGPVNGARLLARSIAILRRVAAGVAVSLALAGCSLEAPQPPDTTDPAITKTRAGALQAYYGVVVQFRRAFGGVASFSPGGTSTGDAFVALTGELTDELQNSSAVAGSGGSLISGDAVDRRALEQGADAAVDGAYSALQKVRGQASQSIGLLNDYAPDQPALVGHVYTLEGYAEVFLAELFCSGVPLSTLDYNGDYTYRPGSSTTDVLKHAVTLFDSTLALASDSVRTMDLARLGKARALLDLGDYVQAASAVSMVSDDYTYKAYFGTGTAAQDDQRNFILQASFWAYTVGDREGLRGLDYVSSGDPRTAVQRVNSRNLPLKYDTLGASPIVVASGIEARLIEAEAALRGQDYVTWRDKLNHLRQMAWPTITDCSSGTCQPGAPGPLPDLDDPGAAFPDDPAAADSARVDLLFRERAFWLFLTGHRQGDLRRLIRQYGRQQEDLYPVEAYPGGGFYGSTVAVPIPAEERQTNPLFTGCFSTGA